MHDDVAAEICRTRPCVWETLIVKREKSNPNKASQAGVLRLPSNPEQCSDWPRKKRRRKREGPELSSYNKTQMRWKEKMANNEEMEREYILVNKKKERQIERKTERKLYCPFNFIRRKGFRFSIISTHSNWISIVCFSSINISNWFVHQSTLGINKCCCVHVYSFMWLCVWPLC